VKRTLLHLLGRSSARIGAACLLAGAASAQLVELSDGAVDQQRKIGSVPGSPVWLDQGDQFGRSCTAIGDLDGDGIRDLLVGAPNDDGGGTNGLHSNVGAVWLLFMNPDGTVRESSRISKTLGNFQGDLDDLDQFGRAAADIGDFDGDGIPDIVVGSARDDDGGNNRGSIWMLFLDRDGSVKWHNKISSQWGGFTGVLDDFDEFGRAITSLGDLDGDGVTDLAIGAAGDDDGGNARGAVWILFLNPDGSVKSHQKISQLEGGFTGQLRNDDWFGLSVANLGDLDNDGVVDLAVGAPKDRGLTHREGAVWILFLNANGTVKSHTKINRIEGGFPFQWTHCNEFGTSIAPLGDIDGDGQKDMIVGAIMDSELGQAHGAVWIVFLQSDGSVKVAGKINDAHGGFIGDLSLGDWFGSSVCSFGDLDGNGTRDVAVGARFDDQGGQDTGAVYVLLLEGAKQARTSIVHGTGANQSSYASNNDPIMGTTWHGQIDTSSSPDVFVTYLVGYDRLLPVPIPTVFGELIIDVSASFFLQSEAPAFAGASNHYIPVPVDPALEGFTIHTQGITFGNQVRLLNGLDLYIGH